MLAIQNIYKHFDGAAVLRDISLHITAGEIVCLLGPSGCGKTTLLRVIAGLERAKQGDIHVDGKSIMDMYLRISAALA